MMKSAFQASIAALALLVAAQPVSAQFNGGMDWVINRTRMPNIIQCPGCDADDDDEVATAPSRPVARPATNPAALNYRPSAQRRQQNLASFFRGNDGFDPRVDMIGQIDAEMRKFGLRSDNVADAYAVWWVSAWEAVHRRDMPDSRGMYQAVRRQAERSLLSDPAIVQADEATKQQTAEALLIQAALIDAHVDAAKGNPQQTTTVANAVEQGARRMGVDLRALELSEAGFSARTRR